ncbi:MAG: 1A family penicillin-binding protein [Candidatus Gottesmanbacteria bacterium GW2011_GWA2_43_14]|uniref:1A family penicillin-binding protein n=1 Tax=Candidatus Gottesmanbacteria bacterium GW2011_GWA2_43_14 TaxID=1618443 RepID=A0A0G1FS38_9BACT|nr:MAG: 1A family penicillin-binding protein [Candidatus Gottesmanbacteria bacterium GW2011_GWA2_43_14]
MISQKKNSKKKIVRKSVPRKKLAARKDRIVFDVPVMGLTAYFKKNERQAVSKPSKSKTVKKTKTKTSKRKIKAKNKRRVRILRPLILLLLIMASSSSVAFYFLVLKDLPNPRQLALDKPAMTTIIRDRNGRVLYRVYNNANRVQLTWDEIPEVVKNSTIAIEDAQFYKHQGISLKAITRALLHNLRQEDVTFYQGGSTITQQLIKNRFFSPVKSYERKIKEIILSVWTEFVFEKEEILTFYLNTVGYGGPAYGIEAASQTYFGIPAKDLTLAQAAFLAGLPAAPTTFSPFGTEPEISEHRQAAVLERMVKLGMISQADYLEAVNEEIVFAPQKIDIAAPHFVMYVKQELSNKLGEKVVEEGGLDVTTTIDMDIQSKTEELVRKNIEELGDRYNINNAATLITSPQSGEILAMVGSVDYFDRENDGHFNAVLARRQPGSSIKPVNYGYAFDHGFTPTSVILDAPVVYRTPHSQESYAPVNYDGKFHGNVTLRSALANSYNIPAVKLLEKVGVNNMIKTGIAMGINSWYTIPPIGLSLTLGGAEVTMLDMARAYGTIANMGVRKDLKSVLTIKDSNDSDVTDNFYRKSNLSLVGMAEASTGDQEIAEGTQVISPLSAYWLIDILSDKKARTPAFGNYARLSVPEHKIAVKTGTSNSFRDNWTIGFSPDYLVATWVGNNDGSYMNRNLVSGITGAAPIWHDTMTYLLEGKTPSDFPKPEGLVPVKVCAANGLLTCANCPEEKIEYFTVDKVPTKKCFFRPAPECEEAKKQAEGKSDEEKKALLSGCPFVN